MSASTERLVEQIKSIEAAISAAELTNQDTSVLKGDLMYYQRKLAICNEALTEGKQLLKS